MATRAGPASPLLHILFIVTCYFDVPQIFVLVQPFLRVALHRHSPLACALIAHRAPSFRHHRHLPLRLVPSTLPLLLPTARLTSLLSSIPRRRRAPCLVNFIYSHSASLFLYHLCSPTPARSDIPLVSVCYTFASSRLVSHVQNFIPTAELLIASLVDFACFCVACDVDAVRRCSIYAPGARADFFSPFLLPFYLIYSTSSRALRIFDPVDFHCRLRHLFRFFATLL